MLRMWEVWESWLYYKEDIKHNICLSIKLFDYFEVSVQVFYTYMINKKHINQTTFGDFSS